MEKLAEIEHPKPLARFSLTRRSNAFAAAHPLGRAGKMSAPSRSPGKMYERYQSRSRNMCANTGWSVPRGFCSGNLSQVWKVLAQTVPDGVKTDEVVELEIYFRELIRGVDSSLLEEWERLAQSRLRGDRRRRQAGAARGLRSHTGHHRFSPARAHGHLRFPAGRGRARLGKARRRGWRVGERRSRRRAGPNSRSPPRRDGSKRRSAPTPRRVGRFRLDPEGRSGKHTYWSEQSPAAGEWGRGADVDRRGGAQRTGRRGLSSWLAPSHAEQRAGPAVWRDRPRRLIVVIAGKVAGGKGARRHAQLLRRWPAAGVARTKIRWERKSDLPNRIFLHSLSPFLHSDTCL